MSSDSPSASFLDAAAKIGVAFDGGDLDRLVQYLALLEATNAKFNLTRITDPEEMWTRHVLDSLTLLPLIASTEATTLIDVGSGGGLPGIPLAITMSDVEVTLLEATGKKAAFLEEVRDALQLGNVRVVCERAETIGQDREFHREHYDVAIARAVGPLPVLLELTLPLVRVGGFVLAVKGAKAEDEVDAARTALHRLHASVEKIERTSTGRIVVIAKRRATPKIYPRGPGEPKRAPL